MSRLPLIGVTVCSRQIGLYAYHISGDCYVHAKASIANGAASTLPSPVISLAPSDILDGPQHILFTTRLSNIEPFDCAGPAEARRTAHDSARTTVAPLHSRAAFNGMLAWSAQWQSVSSHADASINA
ncbi:glutamine amidotransferase [Pseudomonas prosekii]|uniref:Glutamine amidotransferase n=1 Tax=Pseudomonas prosekii TaxID=1148509 RepID=A0A2U2D052_9PSED|nr:glutamine amidotransferase [Pseudomonas prosekii]